MDQGIELLDLLKNQIDLTHVPFSDRGRRILIYQHADRSCLFVKLAERLIHVEPGVESYLRRPPFIDDLCFIDERGLVLDFNVVTSPDIIKFETRLGTFQLVFQASGTFAFGLPDHTTCGIRFHVNSTHWHTRESGGDIRHVRNLGYDVLNGQVITNRTISNFPAVEIIIQTDLDCSITIRTWDGVKQEYPLVPFSTIREEARSRWIEWFNRAPKVSDEYKQKYAYAWWVMGNNLVNPKGYLTRRAMVPSKSSYVGAWLWDSAFHAIAYRHMDIELARDQIRVMLAQQLDDGMLPDVIFDEGVVAELDHPIWGRVTKPPILTWAVLKIHETEPDLDFLREVYEPLTRENRWWFEFNDDDKDGIVQYTHPYSSGLDDSPLWDHGMPAESPDINTYLQIQMTCLARIAEILGRADEARSWREQAQALKDRMIQQLWDEARGLFNVLHDGKPIPVLTPFHLLPLWTAELPDRINRRLIAHLQDPQTFAGHFSIPTVAFNDASYTSYKMWRGPVWANINYFFIEALQRVGEHDLARALRKKTLDLIASQPGIWEYYDSQTGIPPATSIPAFGWTSAVFIELAIQQSKEEMR